MTALVQAISRFSAASNTDIETVKMLSLFCGIGLLVSLIVVACSVDLSIGFS
jgi:hypothetical protein